MSDAPAGEAGEADCAIMDKLLLAAVAMVDAVETVRLW
jgi:hypothetical protein